MRAFPAFGVLLKASSQRKAIESVLLANSGLPSPQGSPRGNIELAQSFARSLAAARLEDWHWKMLAEWQAKSPQKAPANSALEYLSFCAVLSLGVLYPGLSRPGRRRALAQIQLAAQDPRWRPREAAAMALQAIGEEDPGALRDIVAKWMSSADFLQKRAIVAGLAHPPLLEDSAFTLFCLSTADAILASLAHAGRAARAREDFKVLRQGLGYALSVLVDKLPEAGFPLLAKWAAAGDADVKWVLRENLRKKRLAERHPREAAEILRALSEGRAAGR